MESHNERIGQLVQRYRDTLALMAGLRDSLNCLSGKLARLSSGLKDNPHWIDVSKDDSITFNHEQDTIGTDAIAELHEKLRAWKDAESERREMESCMRDAGLGDLIRAGPR